MQQGKLLTIIRSQLSADEVEAGKKEYTLTERDLKTVTLTWMNITSLNLFQEPLQKCSGTASTVELRTPETKMRSLGTLTSAGEKCMRSSLTTHNAKEPQGKTTESQAQQTMCYPALQGQGLGGFREGHLDLP